jgi:ubiquitin-small subunit ribosomal protein S27Ae
MAKEQPKAAKKEVKKAKVVKNYYEKSGDSVTRKNKECPKCGSGVFMANHKDRLTCGKCHYTEFRK